MKTDAHAMNQMVAPFIDGEITSSVDEKVVDGVRLVAGGRRILTEIGRYFIKPTLLGNVSLRARIAQEEICGPGLSVISFDDEAEAMRLAEATMYGLIVYAWTSQLLMGLGITRGVRSSLIVNRTSPKADSSDSAFSAEPFHQSGIGTGRGLAGMVYYLRRQLVWINHA